MREALASMSPMMVLASWISPLRIIPRALARARGLPKTGMTIIG